ncbi:diguanylate cyclase (GGDEF)-like protein [Evansella vedderi]|uniref:Diguanylate cyclase (GGDEF)-like protein n=1 Tax=Evansella vedderi TaxID=38282 RepID=A0ABT9ZP73_9BACI|nr:EAL domain-containing protein [Evansella vedderi]MDQ0253038.1 diguanylate cyclase (GGDEF)-like protein [Evansella vedderi]
MFNRTDKKFAYMIIITLIALYFTWNYWFQTEQAFLDWGGVVFQIIACLIVFSWLRSTYKKDNSQARNFWLFLGLGILCYLLGILIWSFLQFVMQVEADSSILPKTFFVFQNGFYFVALLLMMNVMKHNNLLTIRFVFDILIVMSVATTFIWFFIMNPLIQNRENPISFVDFLYPILDLGVLAGVLSLIIVSKTIFTKATSFLLVSGLLVQVIADLHFSYLTATNIYSVGSLSEPLWILSLFILGLAGVYHKPVSDRKHGESTGAKTKGMAFLKHSFPYAGVILLSIYVISQIQYNKTILLGLFLSILLVILRQVFTLLDNDKLVNDLNNLNEELEIKVKERTDRLVETVNKMEHLAYHDVVTGLPNRRYIERRLTHAIKNTNLTREKKMAFLLLDLDRFKQINDSLGHSSGDLLLKEVGTRLGKAMRPNEIVCRIGGDEFAILMENATMEKIERKAETILSALRKGYKITGVDLHVTPSIGISFYPEHGEDFEALMMKSDTAMYKVKENGKNHYRIYNETMDIEPQLTLENSLRKGLEKNEFELYYQPQVSLDNGKFTGVEALLRWNSRSQGFVPPSDFIPIAEETGLIIPIGEWVFREVCKQSVKWEKQGYKGLRVAVNLSSLQFQQRDFVESLESILTETKANPDNIELEITESIAMGTIECTIAKLTRLKEIGFHIAIDDFGTGYSSLQYMSNFPIDRLKIDRSFISRLNTNDKNDSIVKLIVMIAKGLNFKVIAEGVEKESQMEFLQSIGCDEIQGYLISKPEPLSVTTQMLSQSFRGDNKYVVGG